MTAVKHKQPVRDKKRQQYSICGKTREGAAMYFWPIFDWTSGSIKTWGLKGTRVNPPPPTNQTRQPKNGELTTAAQLFQNHVYCIQAAEAGLCSKFNTPERSTAAAEIVEGKYSV